MKGFIVYPTYKNIEDRTYVQLFGRLENGQSFVTQNLIKPYLFIEEKQLKKAKPLLTSFKTEKTKLTNFQDKKVIKISSKSQTDLNKLQRALHKKEIQTYEADIKPHFRFMIDNNLLGSIEIEEHIEYESSEKIDRIYKNPTITPSNQKPNLKIASIDIETDDKQDNLYCIGIYTEKHKEVFMVTNKKLKKPYITSCKNEHECLEKFKSKLIELDPDIITGWNFIDFDLKYLKEKFEKNKILFDLGRDNSPTRLRIEAGFFRTSSADISGRQALDGLSLIRDPFIKEAPTIKNAHFKTFTLESVSQAILKEGKLIKGKQRHKEIGNLYKTNQEKLAEYNLQDCKLVYDILEKTKMIDLAVERSMLTGMPLNRITASIASFDSLYIRNAREKNLVSPTTIFKERKERIKGGYVMKTKPGIYHNVLVLDFKSLYPSIIKTFNIDPSSYLEKVKSKKNIIESPNKAYFKNQSGILPEIISKLHEAREKAKHEQRELSSYAIKIIMNSFFGVLASPNCRYYSLEMANAITHFAQMIIKLTAKKIEEKGYKVIYSDTDSVFIDTNLGENKANVLGLKIQNDINKFYENFVKKEYNRKSYLELEFEKQYLSFLLPATRKSETGSKKRYAGLKEVKGKER